MVLFIDHSYLYIKGKPFVELLNQNRTKIYEDLQIK
jgi:hypothetical protein